MACGRVRTEQNSTIFYLHVVEYEQNKTQLFSAWMGTNRTVWRTHQPTHGHRAIYIYIDILLWVLQNKYYTYPRLGNFFTRHLELLPVFSEDFLMGNIKSIKIQMLINSLFPRSVFVSYRKNMKLCDNMNPWVGWSPIGVGRRPIGVGLRPIKPPRRG